MFETSITSTDYISVTWPFSLTLGSGSSLTGSDGSVIALTSSGNGATVYLAPASTVQSNVWYELSVIATGSPTAGLYRQPISLATVSSASANAVIYDENSAAGNVAYVAAAGTISDI